jgi:uncharacterized protein
MKVLTPHHPFRIFIISSLLTVLAVAGVWYYMGLPAALVTLVLIIIEVTFSFDNAIINARVLTTMTHFWQQIFMTLGMLIAVFGMRLVFPILLVMATAGLPWGQVIDLALNHPEMYAKELADAHVGIASFGGMFLLMLCLHFFFDRSRNVRWITEIERPLQKIGRWWTYGVVGAFVLVVVSFIPFNHHPQETFIAGLCGMATYIVIHGLAELFTKSQKKQATGKMVQKAGMAGFISFMYLEVLDASFSLDGVIGAFAVTNDVVLITIGLGIGALWVRSLNIYMVRREILSAYKYIEHGAHYTIGVLSVILLAGLFFDVPEAVAGVLGLAIVGASVYSSVIGRRKLAYGNAHKISS